MDTANKRASAVHVSLPWRGLLPTPDAVADAGDRAQAAFLYRGIADGGTPPPAPNASEWLIRARRRGRR